MLETLYFQSGELGLRQIALISGLYLRSAELALKDLQKERLLRRRKSGARVYFSLNREHPAYSLLSCLFESLQTYRIRVRAQAVGDDAKEMLRFVVAANRMMEKARGNRHADR